MTVEFQTESRTVSLPSNRIDRCFQERSGRAALLLYVTAGHPNLETSRWVTPLVAELADMIEIGVPFSDPVADGPVIQESTQLALRHGTKISHCLEIASATRAAADTPIVFLTYYNPVLHYGLDRFVAESAEAGVDGIICADLPAEESQPLQEALASHNMRLIPMVAPTSTDERLAAAGHHGSGFIYCVSRAGVTGVQESLNKDLPEFLARVRRFSELPRAVGFGVSNAEHARTVAAQAEGVIIGSALVSLIAQTLPAHMEDKLREFVAGIREGMDGHA